MILAGDIGGTNCRLAIFKDDAHAVLREQVFRNVGGRRFEDVVKEFLGRDKPDRACFGVAGAVRDGVVQMTNVGWRLEESALERELGILQIGLINDMVAHAENVDQLREDQIETIRAGSPMKDGGGAVIIAGTGLGESGLYFDRATKRRRGVASEGGHCDFAPRNEREQSLHGFAISKAKPTTWETFVSGPGLRLIYDFIRATENRNDEKDFGPTGPPPEKISAAAVSGDCPICKEAAEMFVSLYAAEAGNLALKYCATAGIWIGGGIARTLITMFRTKLFEDAFVEKGPPRIREMLAGIPVRLIKEELNGLYGAANFAKSM